MVELCSHAPDAPQRLLDAATLLFAEKGFEGVGIREIAKSAGVNSSLVAYHFTSKEGLYQAVLKRGFESCPSRQLLAVPLFELEQRLPSPQEAVEAIRQHLQAFAVDVLSARQDPYRHAFAMLLIREMHRGGPFLEELNREMMRPRLERIQTCIRVLRPNLTPEQVFYTVGAIQGSLLVYAMIPALIRLNYGREDVLEKPDELVQFLAEYHLQALGIPSSEHSHPASF